MTKTSGSTANELLQYIETILKYCRVGQKRGRSNSNITFRGGLNVPEALIEDNSDGFLLISNNLPLNFLNFTITFIKFESLAASEVSTAIKTL